MAFISVNFLDLVESCHNFERYDSTSDFIFFKSAIKSLTKFSILKIGIHFI
ncbi:hypothetical protein GW891_03905 [bacterium]|nr:hypothetical protein [bacterium]